MPYDFDPHEPTLEDFRAIFEYVLGVEHGRADPEEIAIRLADAEADTLKHLDAALLQAGAKAFLQRSADGAAVEVAHSIDEDDSTSYFDPARVADGEAYLAGMMLRAGFGPSDWVQWEDDKAVADVVEVRVSDSDEPNALVTLVINVPSSSVAMWHGSRQVDVYAHQNAHDVPEKMKG